jgi:hypothetical protein
MEKVRKCGGVGGGINVSYTAYLSMLDEFFTQKNTTTTMMMVIMMMIGL